MAKRRKFEGQEVVEVKCRVVGAIGDGRLNATVAPNTRLVIVAEGIVGKVEHVETDVGLVRQQRIKIAEGFVLGDESDADDLIHKLRAERQRQLDELLGTPPLDGMEDV